MTGAEDFASFAHEGVRISALVPATWGVTEVSDTQVRFYGPAHPEHDDYRSTFSISLGEPQGYGPDWFETFCNASLATLERELSQFELRTTERYALSSFVDIHALWYTWASESGLAFDQLQALGLMDRYHLYLINAATMRPLADEYLPVFDTVLRSLRMLPGR